MDVMLLYYRKYALILKRVVKAAKRLYFDNLIIKSDNKIRTIWRIINAELASSPGVSAPTEIAVNDEMVTDTHKICDSFNRHFANIGKPSARDDGEFLNMLQNLQCQPCESFF